MTELHPAAPHNLPWFITAPDETDVLMIVMSVVLVLTTLTFGILYFRLHCLPEHIAHKSHKVQFEIVAVLGLIAMFTHMHFFWMAGLLLALIDIPDFGARWVGSRDQLRKSPALMIPRHRKPGYLGDSLIRLRQHQACARRFVFLWISARA